MRRILTGLLPLLVGVSFCLAEGTVTETVTSLGSPNRYAYAWTASTNGIATYQMTYIRGELLRVVSKSTSVVTATYTLRLWDSLSNDVLSSQGVGLASNTTTTLCPGVKLSDNVSTNVVPMVANDSLLLTISGIGTNASGQVTIYVR